MSRVKRSIMAAFRALLDPSEQRDIPFIKREITLVAQVLSERDRALLSRLADEHQWALHFARSSTEIWEVLNQRKAQIVLFEREAPDAHWRELIREVASGPRLVCAILISDVTDDNLWNEVVLWGGHEVLVTPLREENVLRAIRLAWLYWNSAMKNNAGAPQSARI
jgi:AmiR/NasT family two-component response regulator